MKIRERKLNFGFWFRPNPLKPYFKESFVDNKSFCWAKLLTVRPSRDLIFSKTYWEIHLNAFSKAEVIFFKFCNFVNWWSPNYMLWPILAHFCRNFKDRSIKLCEITYYILRIFWTFLLPNFSKFCENKGNKMNDPWLGRWI